MDRPKSLDLELLVAASPIGKSLPLLASYDESLSLSLSHTVLFAFFREVNGAFRSPSRAVITGARAQRVGCFQRTVGYGMTAASDGRSCNLFSGIWSISRVDDH